MTRVLVWAEDRPLEIHKTKMRQLYPEGIHGAIAEFLSRQPDLKVRTAVMTDQDQGLSKEILSATDVLVFWSHKHWRELEDVYVDAIHERVLEGMGIILLHSAHASKVFAKLMGTHTQCLRWRENDEHQRHWIVCPGHPIVRGIKGEYIEIPLDETYGEYFDIPQPDTIVFLASSEGGEVLRSGCCFRRGQGKLFYFSAGHETYPVYYQGEVQQVITNAVYWSRPDGLYGEWPSGSRECGPLSKYRKRRE